MCGCRCGGHGAHEHPWPPFGPPRSHQILRWLILLLSLLSFLLSCAPARQPPSPPSPASTKGQIYHEVGYASWYGKEFHGRRTSSGEVYDMHALTAAHRTLPLGTVVQVTNSANGRSVQVRINDRGPFVANRILDLSYRAAQEIDMAEKGLAWIRLEAWPNERELSLRRFTVQVGSFQVEENARRFKEKMERYGPASIKLFQTDDQRFYRVRVGDFASEPQAQTLARWLTREGFSSLVMCAD